MAQVEVGRRVKVVVLRDKKELNMEVTISQRPATPEEKPGAKNGP